MVLRLGLDFPVPITAFFSCDGARRWWWQMVVDGRAREGGCDGGAPRAESAEDSGGPGPDWLCSRLLRQSPQGCAHPCLQSTIKEPTLLQPPRRCVGPRRQLFVCQLLLLLLLIKASSRPSPRSFGMCVRLCVLACAPPGWPCFVTASCEAFGPLTLLPMLSPPLNRTSTGWEPF